MKAKQIFLFLSLSIALLISPAIYAQEKLEISKVFEQYGKNKGVVMVDLSGEVLKEYNFSLFKSITIKKDPSAANFVRKCIAKDQEGAKKIKEVVVNGFTTSIYLELPQRNSHGDYRIILFNESTNPDSLVTLIYIESPKNSEEVLKLILKKQ